MAYHIIHCPVVSKVSSAIVSDEIGNLWDGKNFYSVLLSPFDLVLWKKAINFGFLY